MAQTTKPEQGTNPASEVAATPKAAPSAPAAPSPLDRFEQARERCVKLFGSEERFIEEATHLLAMAHNVPALQECTPNSINGVLLSVASTGLSLNPVLKLCYVIPRNVKVKTKTGDAWEKRAMVEPSYMGLMKLATDSGAVRNFEVHEVYQGDEFVFDLVQKAPTVHRPYWTLGRQRGKLIGVYGFAVLADGTRIPEHMGADELAKIQSKSDNKAGSVYSDWAGEMARKSLVKRLQKYVPRTEKAQQFYEAVDLDNKGYELAPAATGLNDVEQQVEMLKARARELFGTYKGTDKATLRKKAADEAMSGRQNVEFWEDLILMMEGQSEPA
jgi:recombination protein RecT